MRDVIRAHRTDFPSLVVDWPHIVAESMFQAADISIISISEQFRTFSVLVEASVSVRDNLVVRCTIQSICVEVSLKLPTGVFNNNVIIMMLMESPIHAFCLVLG